MGLNTVHCLGCTEILVDHDQKAAGDPVNSFSTLVMQRQLSHILLGRKGGAETMRVGDRSLNFKHHVPGNFLL